VIKLQLFLQNRKLYTHADQHQLVAIGVEMYTSSVHAEMLVCLLRLYL
jgi:hypothetical protein